MILECSSLIILSQSKNFDTNAWEARVRVVCEFVVSFISHHFLDEQPFSPYQLCLEIDEIEIHFQNFGWMEHSQSWGNIFFQHLLKLPPSTLSCRRNFLYKFFNFMIFIFLETSRLPSHCGVQSSFHVMKSMEWGNPWVERFSYCNHLSRSTHCYHSWMNPLDTSVESS